MKLSPICLFTYNRLEETKATVEALKKNFLASQSELYIFSDGPKNDLTSKQVQSVRDYLGTINGFALIKIYETKTNIGLANSIISGVSKVLKAHGRVIVLEDDLITTPNFLDFMNQALQYYAKTPGVKSINGFSLDILKNDKVKSDVYFHNRSFSWGWATWSDRWNKKIFSGEYVKKYLSEEILTSYGNTCGVDAPKMLMRSLNGQNDSWFAKWQFAHFIENRVAVYPYTSKVVNIGYNSEGTHCKSINVYKSKIDTSFKRKFIFNKNIHIEAEESKRFLSYFGLKHKILYRLALLRSISGIKLLHSELKVKLS